MQRTLGITRHALVATLVVILVLVASSCSGGGSTTEETDPTTSVATTTSVSQSPSTSSTTATTSPPPVDAQSLSDLVIVGVEFGESGFATIQNRSNANIDVSGVFICQFPEYSDLGTQVEGGVIPANDSVEISASVLGGLSSAGGEVALYANDNDFGSADNILVYVQWGSGGQRASVATAANIWPGADVTVIPDPNFNDIVLEGDPVDPENWS